MTKSQPMYLNTRHTHMYTHTERDSLVSWIPFIHLHDCHYTQTPEGQGPNVVYTQIVRIQQTTWVEVVNKNLFTK